MTQTTERGIIFAIGLVVGAGSGVLATMQYFKKRYSEIADQQIADMEGYYQKQDRYARESYDIAYDEAEVNPVNNTDRSQGTLSSETRAEIKEKLLRNYEETTNYAAIYKEKNPDFPEPTEADENPVDDLNEAELATAEHQENRNKSPKIISIDEYENLPAHIDKQTLYFYDLDETLVDDNDEEIIDPAALIGDGLTKYNFVDSDEAMIFVYNPALDTAYEIQRVGSAYHNGY